MSDQPEPRGRLGLALGGGGARGIAHLGVLQALEAECIRADLIVGTSIGALGGALYALEPDAKAVTERVFSYLKSSGFEAYGKGLADKKEPGRLGRLWLNFKRAAALAAMSFKAGLVNPRRLSEAVDGLLPDKRFDETLIPLYVTAFDVLKAEVIVLDSGSLRDAVTASANLAGFFPPRELGGRLLCDASPLVPVPVIAARQAGAGRVIAVDISSSIPEASVAPTGTDVVMRLTAACSEKNAQIELASADVIVRPEVGELFWSDFSGVERLVEVGRRAVTDKLDEIRAIL